MDIPPPSRARRALTRAQVLADLAGDNWDTMSIGERAPYLERAFEQLRRGECR